MPVVRVLRDPFRGPKEGYAYNSCKGLERPDPESVTEGSAALHHVNPHALILCVEGRGAGAPLASLQLSLYCAPCGLLLRSCACAGDRHRRLSVPWDVDRPAQGVLGSLPQHALTELL